MRAINYLKNRFSFALQNSGNIKVNENDVTALNDIINWANNNPQNSQLEDSLLLFWVFCYWSVEIQNNKPELVEKPKGFLEISDLRDVLNSLCTRLHPKDEIKNRIALTLQTAQMANGIPKEKLISEDEVSETLENMLMQAKHSFKPISTLSKNWNVKYHYSPMSAGEKQLMDKFKLINIKSADHILNVLLNCTPADVLDEVKTRLFKN